MYCTEFPLMSANTHFSIGSLDLHKDLFTCNPEATSVFIMAVHEKT